MEDLLYRPGVILPGVIFVPGLTIEQAKEKGVLWREGEKYILDETYNPDGKGPEVKYVHFRSYNGSQGDDDADANKSP